MRGTYQSFYNTINPALPQQIWAILFHVCAAATTYHCSSTPPSSSMFVQLLKSERERGFISSMLFFSSFLISQESIYSFKNKINTHNINNVYHCEVFHTNHRRTLINRWWLFTMVVESIVVLEDDDVLECRRHQIWRRWCHRW